jgi:predicted metal-binding transcription factor (methanogenesis marker protein 9)
MARANEQLNHINRTVQRFQREAGHSFVSRTTLSMGDSPGFDVVVFRCVIMNPMTNIDILREILDEQEEIYKKTFA